MVSNACYIFQKFQIKKLKIFKNLYKKGDLIKVKVIYINSSQGKIAVSAKQVAN